MSGPAVLGAAVEVSTNPDGTLVIRPHGTLGAAEAIELRRVLVRAIRRDRPLRLVLELADLDDALDSINLGTLAAACSLGDDYQVAVFLDHPSAVLADNLTAAGVPAHRLRTIAG